MLGLVAVGVVGPHVRGFHVHGALCHVRMRARLRALTAAILQVLGKDAAVGEHERHCVANLDDLGVRENLVLVPRLEQLDELGLEIVVDGHERSCHHARQVLHRAAPPSQQPSVPAHAAEDAGDSRRHAQNALACHGCTGRTLDASSAYTLLGCTFLRIESSTYKGINLSSFISCGGEGQTTPRHVRTRQNRLRRGGRGSTEQGKKQPAHAHGAHTTPAQAQDTRARHLGDSTLEDLYHRQRKRRILHEIRGHHRKRIYFLFGRALHTAHLRAILLGELRHLA